MVIVRTWKGSFLAFVATCVVLQVGVAMGGETAELILPSQVVLEQPVVQTENSCVAIEVGTAVVLKFQGELGAPVVSNWRCTAEKLFPGGTTTDQEQAVDDLIEGVLRSRKTGQLLEEADKALKAATEKLKSVPKESETAKALKESEEALKKSKEAHCEAEKALWNARRELNIAASRLEDVPTAVDHAKKKLVPVKISGLTIVARAEGPSTVTVASTESNSTTRFYTINVQVLPSASPLVFGVISPGVTSRCTSCRAR